MTSSFKTTRRRLLGSSLATAGLGLLPLAARAEGQVPVTTALGWIPNVEYAGLWIGLEKGYFRDEGIDLHYSPGGPNAPDVLVRMASGQADYAGGDWVPFFEALKRGNDFVVLGAAFPTSPAAVMSLAKAPVREPKDLIGKRILSQLPGDKTTIDFVLDKAGLPHDYTLVQTGFSPEPLLAGDGDAYMAFATNQPVTFEGMGMVEGKDFFVTLWRDLGYDVPAGPIVAQRSYVEKNRGLVVGYLRALARGWIENGKDPEVAAKLAVTKYGADFGLDLKQQIRQNQLGQPLITAPGAPGPFWFDKGLMASNILPVAKAAGITDIPHVDTLIDLGPLEEALKSL